MRKSPMSNISRESGSDQSFNRYRNVKHNNPNCHGYNYGARDNFNYYGEYNNSQSPQSQRRGEFSPLQASSPMHFRYSGGHDNSSSYRGPSNNHYNNSYGHGSSPQSPQWNNRNFQRNRMPYHKTNDVSQYFDPISMLEDPWEDLMKEFNKQKASNSSIDDSVANCSTAVLHSSSVLSQESTGESTSLTDTTADFSDNSQETKHNSSIDLKLDNCAIGQESSSPLKEIAD